MFWTVAIERRPQVTNRDCWEGLREKEAIRVGKFIEAGMVGACLSDTSEGAFSAVDWCDWLSKVHTP